MRSILLSWTVLYCLCGFANASDLVVVVNLNSGIEKLNKDDVVNIFMGRYRQLASGVAAEPIDLANPISAKQNFYSIIVGKELSEINSYWARLKFSGQRSPPRQVDSDEAVIQLISKTTGGIGYIDKTKADKRVRVVLDLSV